MSQDNSYQHHDAFTKHQLTDLRVAQDVLKYHLPKDISEQFNWQTLQVTSGNFVPKYLRQRYSDIMYKCQMNNQTAYIYALIEHKSSPDAWAPFQLLMNKLYALDEHKRSYPNKFLPVIVPLLLYHGKESPYPHSTDVYQCFANPKLAQKVGLLECPLADLSIMSDDDTKQHKQAAVMTKVLKDSLTKDCLTLLAELVQDQEYRQILNDLDDASDSYFQSVLNYLYQLDNQGAINELDVLQFIKEQIPEKESAIMSIAQEIEQRGLKKGRQEGIEKGVKKGIQQTAYNMLKDGMSVDSIKRYTGITDDDIKLLKRDLDSD